MFTLVLILMTSQYDSRQMVMTNVDGFSSESRCEAEGKKFILKHVYSSYSCIQTK